ncbi:helix-turn-helix domain-containing protein [Fimbriiglobus ruber]|uniref:helix-turn-helix domain-containing protein n=1 Tax=Fimbriiglobus ruber TaxID=1908690 RepID=UPI001EE6E908|nr:helix-turn-helix transcriptional regulator [Fimbriiglobus ruber]
MTHRLLCRTCHVADREVPSGRKLGATMVKMIKVNGPKAKAAREKSLLRQEELAEKARVSKRTIQRLENGEDISPLTIRLVAEALKVEVSALLADTVEDKQNAGNAKEAIENSEKRQTDLVDAIFKINEPHPWNSDQLSDFFKKIDPILPWIRSAKIARMGEGCVELTFQLTEDQLSQLIEVYERGDLDFLNVIEITPSYIKNESTPIDRDSVNVDLLPIVPLVASKIYRWQAIFVASTASIIAFLGWLLIDARYRADELEATNAKLIQRQHDYEDIIEKARLDWLELRSASQSELKIANSKFEEAIIKLGDASDKLSNERLATQRATQEFQAYQKAYEKNRQLVQETRNKLDTLLRLEEGEIKKEMILNIRNKLD